jgi:FlaA1/EpsC-like NDP-sugar epimerase
MKKLGYEEFALVRHGRGARPFDAPVLTRSFFHAFVDLVLLACSIVLAIWLRIDRWALAPDVRPLFYQALSMLAPAAVIAFAAGGMYRGPWRIDDLRDVLRASRVVLESTLVASCLAWLLYDTPPPLSLFVVYMFLMLAAVNGARFLTGVVVRGYSPIRRVEPPAVVYTARRAA